ncbi:MAG: hypothetical protein M0Z44_03510 [Gammaproteobacteria bacterium]|nr:hypothetical protein [Gammaproteobacteria bacterium]
MESVTRQRLIVEAARLMAEEGVRDYQMAKRKAAHRLNLPEDKNWPTNAEIEVALKEHLQLFHQEHRQTLRALRETAVRAMELLAPFTPRLVGEVLSGALPRFPEVQLHLTADSLEDVDLFLSSHDIPHDLEERRLRYGHDRHDPVPVLRFVAGDTPLALYVFTAQTMRETPLSPVDGQPMSRASQKEVAALVAASA